MSANDEKVRLKIRLTVEEKTKLEYDAALCGLTQSEYLRQICLGKRPRPKQPPEFWELLDALYEIHDKLERLAVYYPEVVEECSRIERLVLLLQEVEMGPRKAALWLCGERSVRRMVSFRRLRRKR